MSSSAIDDLIEPLSSAIGFPTDQLKFVLCHLLAYPLGYLYNILPLGQIRHIYTVVIGTLMLYVCFGLIGTGQFFLISGIMYTIFNFLAPQHLPKASFVIMFSYLSYLHIYRMVTDYMGWKMDVTAAIMVITIKITTLACNYCDGKLLDNKEDVLLPAWREFAIKNLPSPLEYYSYLCFFPTFLSGPSFHIKPYLSWINGQLYKDPKHNPEGHKPNPTRAVIECIASAILNVVAHLVLVKTFPLEPFYHKNGLSGQSIFYSHIVLYFGAIGVRCQYYFIWKLAEGAGILSGLGFSGYTPEGVALWSRLTNVFIWKIESFGCLRDLTTYWNYKTGEWLKTYVYFRQTTNPNTQRVPWYALYLTNTLSAFWHGFYPGYYCAFVFAAITVDLARKVRSMFRPMATVMQGKEEKKLYPHFFVYDILGRIFSAWLFNFGFVAFVGLSVERTWNAYVNIGFSGYVIAVIGWIGILTLESIYKKPKITKLA